VHDNKIKQWKNTHTLPFSRNEMFVLAKGIRWFGDSTNRWSLISKCFLPNRTPYFLKIEYNNIL